MMAKDSQSLLNRKGCVPALGVQVIVLISHPSSRVRQALLPDLVPFMPFLSWNWLEIDFETEARGCINFPLGGVTVCLLAARLGYFRSLLYACVFPWLRSLRQAERDPIFLKPGWWGRGDD